ncbi:hypothetical protein GCM10027048_15910 [Hymenobacter coalescens]
MTKFLPLLGLLSSWGAYSAQAQCPAPPVSSAGAASVCNGQVSLSTTLGTTPLRYASSVLRFSSQYNDNSWAAAQVLGTPNVYPRHGDLSGAWASSDADGSREFLVLRFDNPAPAKRILIWETYNPGAIDTVFVRNPTTQAWVPVYTATAAAAGANSRILNINFPLTSFPVRDVRIALNSDAVAGWNELDAVALSDEAASYQWARNGVDLPATTTGATGPGLANLTTSGAYSVRVTNDAGCTATSAPFNVMADTAPTVTVAPSGSTTICQGGSATLTATGANGTASVAGRGLRFDGTDDLASVAASSSLHNLSTALTVEAWINPVGAGSAIQNVASKSTQAVNTGYIFPRTDNRWDDLSVWLHIGGAWRVFPVSYTAYKGGWHHVAATYDGAAVKIFIDGAKVLDQPQTGAVATNANPLTLGSQPGWGEYYNGQLDELRLWSVARTEAQILADYNKTVLATQPGLAAYYRLDEGSGTAFVDYTSHGNTGTLGAGNTTPTWINNPAPIRQGLAYSWTPVAGLSNATTAAVLATPTTSTTYRVRATNVNSGCFDEATVTVNVGAAFTWSGAVSTDWTNAANWACGSVPTFGDNITIPAGMPRYPVIGAPAAVRNLTIESGGQLTLSGGTFSVHGQFTNHGSFTQTGGTIAMMGATSDDIGGHSTVFENLTIGTGGARLTAPVQVHGLLMLAGTLNTNGQVLTLLSDASGTATVYNNPGAVQGPVTVQRWINPGLNAGPGYRHLSAPVGGSTVADLATGSFSPVVNPAYNAAANPALVTPFPTVFGYNEMRLQPGPGNTFDTGWESPASLNEPLTPGRGYTVQLSPQTVDFVGPLTNGAVNIPLLRGAAAPGWNLIGNPYPSPLDWDRVTPPAGMDAAAYVYRSTGPYAGSYVSYVNGVGPPGSHLLPMGQAFFVRAAGGTPTLALNNTHRVTTLTDPALHRTTADTRPLLALALRTAGAATDVLYVYQQAGATPGFDGRYDALKVQLNGGQQPTLYQAAGPDALSIQGLPTGNQPVAMPLGLHAPQAGPYSFEPQLLHFPPTATLFLEDRLTGTWHDLRQGAYHVQLAQGLSTSRFVLHLNAQRVLAARPGRVSGAELRVYPNPAQGRSVTVSAAGLTGSSAELRLLNSLGQVVRQETVALTGRLLERSVATQQLPAGVYTVQLRTPAGTLTRKLILN